MISEVAWRNHYDAGCSVPEYSAVLSCWHCYRKYYVRGKGTHLSVSSPMAEQIVLRGDFNLEETYDFVRSWEDAEGVSEICKGGFTFSIRGLRDVKVQVFGTGKLIINTDDYADPAELMRIVELMLWGPDDEPVKLGLEKVQFMQSTVYNITVASVARKAGIESSELLRDPDRLTEWELARLKRIYAQVDHANAGELAPGADDYRRRLEELGVLLRIEPLVGELSI